MDIRRIALAVCLLGAAYSASAQFQWSTEPWLAANTSKTTPAHSSQPKTDKAALVTHGFTWSK